MKKPKISIVIPIYNSEKYLNKLFESIKQQTYKDFELILVNDGSTDNSEEICLDYKNNNSNVNYFYKDNSGVSDTRNYGIEKAKGDYLCFVDADDILNKDFLQDFINKIELSSSELVCCLAEKFSSENDINIEKSEDIYEDKEFTDKNKFNILYEKYGGYLCNKFFVRKIIKDNNLKLNNNIHMTEDFLFVYEYLRCISRVYCFDKKNYYYRIITTSASKNLRNKKWFSIYLTMDELLKNIDDYNDYMKNNVSFFYILYIYEGIYRLKFIDDSEFVSNKKQEIEDRIIISKGLIKNLNFIQKLKVFIFKTFNNTYFKIKKGE